MDMSESTNREHRNDNLMTLSGETREEVAGDGRR
jgi:hypothetical protein